MNEPKGIRSRGTKNVRMGLILVIVFTLFILWMLYTASQNQVARSTTGMSGMPEMTQGTPAISSTQMPTGMPGMNP